MPVAIVSVIGWASVASRAARALPRAYPSLASRKRRSSYGSAPNDLTRRIPLTVSCATLVISPYWPPRLRWRLRSLRSSGCSAPMSAGAATSATSDSRQESAKMATSVTTTTAALCSERVISSTTSCLACAVSVRRRARICPVFVPVK